MIASPSARRETHMSVSTQPITLPAHKIVALTRAALFEARRNLGQTWPNPSVGAVVADANTGEIFASAVTASGGRPHAEVLALREAGEKARGALLVTTLEPCSHYGHTPPCADAILKVGIAGVVYGSVDPDPRVSGRGLARLEAHGIAVMPGPFPREADWINLGHSLRVTAKRPYVQIKMAVDADGQVAVGNGKPVWVTGDEARAAAHLLRAQADAILIGRGTIEADNPELTCRLPGLAERSPVRVVLTSSPALSLDTQLMRNPKPPVWIIHRQLADTEAEGEGIKTFAVKTRGGKPDIRAALTKLAAEGITRLLVEGGPTVARAFLDARAVDEITIFRGAHKSTVPTVLPFRDQGLALIEQSSEFVLAGERRVGSDTETVYRNRAHWQG